MKKLLATVSAVALSLAMVAMPSVAVAVDDVPLTDTPPTGDIAAPSTEQPPVDPADQPPADPAASTLLVSANEAKGGGQPADHCNLTDPGWQPKVDEGGEDDFYVSIPEGVTVVAYCVKAANLDLDSPKIITLTEAFVGPGQLLIDHPDVNSVSHYQLQLATPTDPGCDDLTGAKGFSISVDEECPKELVTVQGSAVNQTCEASGDESVGTPVNGSITLTVSDLDGVTKIEYKKDGGSLVDVPLNDLTIDNLAPGSYEFFVTVETDYKPVDNFTVTVNETHDPECKKQTICHWNEGGKGEAGSYNVIDVSIKSIINLPNGHGSPTKHLLDVIPSFDYYDGNNLVTYPGKNVGLVDIEGCEDFQFPTEGPVLAEALFTPATCSTDGSYTLISPELVEGVPAKTVTWFVNDVETEPGTYPVKAGETITVKVVAVYPEDYPVQVGNVINPEFTYPAYEFTAPTACDLNTLALTGAGDTTPALALTAFLGLLGLAMVRSGMRVNRNRQEA